MAKKITLERFLSHLEDDLTWRKKEISSLLFMHNEQDGLLIVKSTILMIYAHWEGYVKNACKQYLLHISDLNIRLSELTMNFEAIHLKSRINEAYKSSESLNLVNEINLVTEFYTNGDAIFNIPDTIKSERNKNFINTRDNLNLKILNSFLKIVGIGEVSIISGKEKYIDTQLLNQRNSISHGSKIDGNSTEFNLDLEDVITLRNFILILMEYVKGELTYYSENELYFSKNHKLASQRYDSSTKLLEKNLTALFDED